MGTVTLELKQNLRRIKELSDTVVPYAHTIRDKINLYDAEGNQGGELFYIYKDKSFAVLEGHIKAGFVHQKHFHEETEIITLLSGRVLVDILGRAIVELVTNIPIIIQPKTTHSIHYLEDTKVLAMTIPASPDFPDK